MLTSKEASRSGIAPMRESSVKAYVGASVMIMLCSFSPLLLSAPRFMHALGIPLSIVLIIISAAYSIYAQITLSEAAYHMASSSLIDLLSRIFRPWVYHITAICTFLTYTPAPEILALVNQTLGAYSQIANVANKIDPLIYVVVKVLYCIVILPFTFLPRGIIHGFTIGCAIAGFLFIVMFLCVCITYGDWQESNYIHSYKHDPPSLPMTPFEFRIRPGVFSPFYYIYVFWVSPTLIGQQNKQRGSYSSRYRWAVSTIFLTVCVTLILTFGISLVSVYFFDGTCTAVDVDCLLLQDNYIVSLIYRDAASDEYIMPYGALIFMILYTASLVLVAVVKTVTLGNMAIPYISKLIRKHVDNHTTFQESTCLQTLYKLAGYSPKLPIGRTLSEPALMSLRTQKTDKGTDIPYRKYYLYILVSGPIVCFTLALTLIVPDLAVLSSLTATVLGSVVCIVIPLIVRYKLSYLRSMSTGRNVDLCAIAARYRENNISDNDSSASSALLDFYSSDTSLSSSSSYSNITGLSKSDNLIDKEKCGLRRTPTNKSLRSIASYSKATGSGSRRDLRLKGSGVERDILAITKRNRDSKISIHKEITEDDLESVQPCDGNASISQLDTFKSVASRMREKKMTVDDAISGIDGSAELEYETLTEEVSFACSQNTEKLTMNHTKYAVGIVIMGTLPDFSRVEIVASRAKKVTFLIFIIAALGITLASFIFQLTIIF